MLEFYLVTISGEVLQDNGKRSCFWKKILCLICGRVSAQVWMKPGAKRWDDSGLFLNFSSFFKLFSLCYPFFSAPFLSSPLPFSPLPWLPCSQLVVTQTDSRACELPAMILPFPWLLRNPHFPQVTLLPPYFGKKSKEVKSALKELKSCVRIKYSRLCIHNANSETPNPKLLEYQDGTSSGKKKHTDTLIFKTEFHAQDYLEYSINYL